MDLTVHFYTADCWQVNLPHCFLNYLLEEQYNFDQGVLCLDIISPFGSHYYCCMKEFTRGIDTLNIPDGINRYLNILENDYVHISITKVPVPTRVVLQGHRNTFGDILDIKVKLESLFQEIRLLNSGITLEVLNDDQLESFDVLTILKDDVEIPAGLIIDCDLEIDFVETKESIALAEAEAQRKFTEQKEKEIREERERRGFKGEGNMVGGTSLDRQAWLDRMETK